MATNMLKNIQ